MTTARVIVTRPARDAAHWVHLLQQSSIAAEALPLIEITGLSGTANAQALRDARKTLGTYDACMFVSGQAVAHFFEENRPFAQWIPAQAAMNTIAGAAAQSFPPSLRFMAPGPGTVTALLAVGVPAAQVDAPLPDARQFDSEALWQVIGQRDWQGRRVLIVRGQNTNSSGQSSGRDWMAAQWRAAGAEVDFVGAYQRLAPALTEAQMQRAQEAGTDGSVWLFTSSEAVANLRAMTSLQDMSWHAARAVATHPRISDAVRAAGWGVVVESRPALSDILQTLGSIESLHP